jgi:hypothetical protein
VPTRGNILQPAANLLFRTLAFFDNGGAGSTIAVDFSDSNDSQVPLVDGAGVKWPSIIVAIPAGKAVGLRYKVKATSPGGSPIVDIPDSAMKLTVRVVAGSVTVNTMGTFDGSAGADVANGNNGISGLGLAPAASTPFLMVAGEIGMFGRTK